MTSVADSPSATRGEPLAEHHFRYPGSPPFRDDDVDRTLFRGRTLETETVLHSILSSDLFLLYSVSGLGKSSLLNAGVMHELRARDHWPVSIRLNDPSRTPLAQVVEQIEAAADKDDSVELMRHPDADAGAEGPSTLWELLASLEVWRDNELLRPVIILDQFEELFTLDWPGDVRLEFIHDFGEVVRRHRRSDGASRSGPMPDVKFVLVIREDSLGELEALAADVPQIMRSRFRLESLDPEQAERAIREPGLVHDERLHSQPFTYTEAAAREILEFLRTKQVRGSEVLTAGVDPSQLQIVCQYVERSIVPRKALGVPPGALVEIDAADLGGREGLDRVLEDFYHRTVESFAARERAAVRHLCETGFINRDGRRLSLEEDDIEQRYGVDHAILERLVNRRLLRAEPRVGSVYYELAHDTLVGPILDYREDREAARRKRRNRWIAGIVAVIAAIALVSALVALAVAESESSADSDAAPQATALAIGESRTGEIDAPGAFARYAIDAEPEAAVVVAVETGDEDLNAIVEITNPDGVTRLVDQVLQGGVERTVLPPVASGDRGHEVLVRSFDATTGEFEISVETIEVTPLTDGEPERAELRTPTDVVVFSTETTDTIRKSVEVAPVTSSDPGRAAPDANEDDLLDVRVEIIDPSGASRSVNEQGRRLPETVGIAEPVGVHHLVVAGHESTTGTFETTATAISGDEIRPLELDEPQQGVVGSPSDVAEFTVEVPGGATGEVFTLDVSPDSGLDAVVDVLAPDEVEGAGFSTDAAGAGGAEFVALSPVAGTHRVQVSGFAATTGGFQIVVNRSSPIPLSTGEEVSGAGPTVFAIDTRDGELTSLSVNPTRTTDLVSLEVRGPNGDVVTFGTSRDLGQPATATVGSAGGATYHAVVVPSPSSASFVASTSSLDADVLRVGEEITGSGSSGFDVAVAPNEVLALTVSPSEPDGLARVTISDPDGISVGFAFSDQQGGPARSVIGVSGAGDYRVLVDVAGASAFTAALETLEPAPLALGESSTVDGVAAYSIDVPQGELFELSARPALDDVLVIVGGFDPLGSAIAPAAAVATEDDAAVILGAAGGGDYLVAVGGSVGSIPVEVELRPVDPQPLSVGEPVVVEGAAAFSVDVSEGAELYRVTARPEAGSGLASVEVLDPTGEQVGLAPYLRPGDSSESIVGAGVAGTYQIVVRTSFATGPTSVELESVDATSLVVGETVTADGAQAFVVEVPQGRLLMVDATSTGGDDSVAIVAVFGPDGSLQGGSAGTAAGVVLGAGGAGSHVVTLVGTPNDATFDLTVEEVDPLALAPGGDIVIERSTPITLAIPDGARVFVTAVPSSPDAGVALQPFGRSGPTGPAVSGSSATPPMVEIVGDGGPAVVVATTSGPGPFAVSAEASP